jgi:3D-(3,5/4)-trihydroxycyclohexane-1,2-dione acylhydrolase (decyclizing)
VDFLANATSLGAHAIQANTREELMEAIRNSKQQTRTSVIVVETDYHDRVAEYGSWWDVPIAEVSEVESVQQAQRHYAKARQRERYFWPSH